MRNEIAVHGGNTVVNSFHSELSKAASVEYRRAIGRYLDASLAFVNEGDSRVVRRNGFITQLWAARSFLDEHLVLGIGGGAYVAVDQRRVPKPNEKTKELLAGIVTMRAALRFAGRWEIPAQWNRVVTKYSRDTDVFLIGVGYRF